jgi:antitoxin VapB
MPTGDQVIMNMERKAALFRNGRSQAVRIPKDFELPGDQVNIRREGGRLVIEPVEKKQTLLEVLASMKPSPDKMPEIDDPFPEPVHIRAIG